MRECAWCGEPVGECAVKSNLIATDGVKRIAFHTECHLRQIFGSVGHQRGLCSCNGGPGTMDDPPGMTKHEAAWAATHEGWARLGPKARA